MSSCKRFIRPTMAHINLRALASNLRSLREKIGPQVGVIAVVKADAYGHGAIHVARLLEGLGVRGFGVATVEEGVELREAKIHSPILIMGAAFGREHKEVIDYNLIPMVGDPGDVEHFAEAAKKRGRVRFGIHVKIDTGMTRLGVTAPRFPDFMRRCASHPSIRVDGLATHFAMADEPNASATEVQLETFIQCLDQARAIGADPQLIHAANSAACVRFPKTRFDLVRPGIVLYGSQYNEQDCQLNLMPVMSLHTRINALREVDAGVHISYGFTHTTTRRSRIATLPVGYADGYPRSLSNRGHVLLHGVRAPIVGRICMDLCMIDVTDIPQARVGDTVVLLGGEGPETIRPEELASWAQTISYEILAGISKRVPRNYPKQEQEIGQTIKEQDIG